MNFIKTIVNAVMTWVNKRFKENTPNWNQNDSNADGYIRNRPFYTGVGTVTLVDNLTSEEYTNGNKPSCNFVSGQSYDVTWNGILYENLVCRYNGGYNIIVSDEGGFIIDDDGGNSLYVSTDEDDWTVSISTIQEIVHKIDPKYMPITGTEGQFVVIGSDGNMTAKTIPNAEEASF